MCERGYDFGRQMKEEVFIKCSNCGTVNRVYKERLEKKPVCGRCSRALDVRRYSYDVPVDVSDESFDQEVLHSRLLVIVDCWAPWCAPCATMGPILDAIASEYKGRFKVAKLNTDLNREIAAQYGINSIPTLLIFQAGKLVDRVVGVVSERQLQDVVNKWL
jgi:thioredoxin 2